MFRKRSPQGNLFASSSLVPRAKAKRLQKSWAEVFQQRALPLIDEESFAPLFCDDNGRPNKPVPIVFGVLLLKEMFSLTDEEALEQVEFNLLWQHALRLTPEEAHLCQKTLHNFRAGLMAHDTVRLVFQETTDRIIAALGVRVSRQRLDSTHIVSNIAVLTRLGLFCETLRVFLDALGRDHPRLLQRVPARLRQRYQKEDGTATRYEDARRDRARRRLAVCARDLYRLHSLFLGTAAANLDQYRLLARLLEEQCEVSRRKRRPDRDDDDAGEGGVPVELKAPKEVSSSSLQTPHDPDVTYSGHKGKGYEVQIAETCAEENPFEVITHLAVTDSCGSDVTATVPTITALAERDLQPQELVADTTYGSGENAVEVERLGTELVSPVGGPSGKAIDLSDESRLLTAADFEIDATASRKSVCPAGHESTRELEKVGAPNQVDLVFEGSICEECPHFARCPARFDELQGGYVLAVNLVAYNLEGRRRAEATGEFAVRYSIRAGIEATNSELKRKHGLGKLRVRGHGRVVLAVCLKALACNIKRMIGALQAGMAEPVAAAG
jgi:hypothetical protein